MPTQAQIDENYGRKMRARIDGTTPVLVIVPEPRDIKGSSPAAIEERYRAKLMQRQGLGAKAEETPSEQAPAEAGEQAGKSKKAAKAEETRA